jgi:hypothetical protein
MKTALSLMLALVATTALTARAEAAGAQRRGRPWLNPSSAGRSTKHASP